MATKTGTTGTAADFKKFVKKNKVVISGLDKMPEIGITRALFENPWHTESEEDSDLFVAHGMRITLAKQPDGSIHALNKVSDDYHLVQHHQALHKSLTAILEKCPEFGVPEVTAKFTNNGGRMYARMLFPQAMEIQKGDPVKPEVILTNSADLSKRFSLAFGAFRLICSNGMIIPDSRFKDYVMIRNLHKNGTLDLDDAIAKMMVGFESFSESIGIWSAYTEKTIGIGEFYTIMEGSLLSENQVQDVLALPLKGWDGNLLNALSNGPVTAWQAYNAATQWITENNKNEATTLDRGFAVSRQFEKVLGMNSKSL